MPSISLKTIPIIILLLTFLINTLAQGQADTLLLQSLEKKARTSYGSSLDSSIYYAQQILDLDEHKKNARYHAFALNWIGICLMRKGYPDSAESYYEKTIAYGAANSEGKYAQMARLNISINYHQQGLFEQSALAAQKSLEAFENSGDTLGMAHAQYNLGNCLFQLNRPNEALTFYNSALKIYIKKGGALSISNTYNAIGNVHHENKEYDKAINEFKNSIKNKISVGGENFCASEYINMGRVFKALELSDSAIFYYKKAYITAEKLGDQQKMANAYVDLADLYNSIFQPNSAKYYASIAESIARAINDNFLTYNGLYQLSKANNSLKSYGKAYRQLSEYVELKDSADNVDIKEKVAALEKRFKVAEKDKELLLNKIELGEQQNAIQRQIGIIFLLSLLVVVILFWVFTRRKKQLLLNKIAINTERNRIAMDLHDHVGAELTLVNSKLDTRVFKTVRYSEKEDLKAISDQIRNVSKTLRETVWSIQEEAITIAQLLERIQGFADKQLAESGIEYGSTTNDNRFELSPQIALTLYRICQEGITNALKYANCSSIKVSTALSNKMLEMDIVDNGDGFDVEKVDSGYGLINIKQRAEKLGGEFKLLSTVSNGTTLHIKIPV